MTLPPGTRIRITAPLGDHTGHTATVLTPDMDLYGCDLLAITDEGVRILLMVGEVEVLRGWARIRANVAWWVKGWRR